MTTPEAIAILGEYQAWRLGAETEQLSPAVISGALEFAISVLKEHEVNPFLLLP